jgi:hypothetical protein
MRMPVSGQYLTDSLIRVTQVRSKGIALITVGWDGEGAGRRATRFCD